MHPYRSPPGPAPGLLIVSGLDPSGGAGFIADVRVAERLGCRPVGVVAALTEQSTLGVLAAHDTQAHIVESQLRLLLGDVEVRAGKLGMLGSAKIAEVVADALAQTASPVVWDPVLAPTRGGAPLFDGNPADALAVLASHLALITPNAAEAARLTGIAVTDEASAVAAARALVGRWVPAALVTGGHLAGAEAVDVLVVGSRVHRLVGPRIPGATGVHGTGCALSTAIAARLAHGDDLVVACKAAKAFVADLLAHAVTAGRGAASVV
jgi:hydroxymethylpyrimidine kinase/phosphomethylpyrimidine kinase